MVSVKIILKKVLYWFAVIVLAFIVGIMEISGVEPTTTFSVLLIPIGLMAIYAFYLLLKIFIQRNNTRKSEENVRIAMKKHRMLLEENGLTDELKQFDKLTRKYIHTTDTQ